jgi:hypothetical protein
MKNCSICSSAIPHGANFCADCGARQSNGSNPMPDGSQNDEVTEVLGEVNSDSKIDRLDPETLTSVAKPENTEQEYGASSFSQICSSCETDVAVGWAFCDNCGTELRFSSHSESRAGNRFEKNQATAKVGKKFIVTGAAVSIVGLLFLGLAPLFTEGSTTNSASSSPAASQVDNEVIASAEPTDVESSLDSIEPSPSPPEVTREEKISQLLSSYLLNTSSTHSSPSNDELILKTTWVVNSRLDEANPELQLETIIKSASAVLGTQIDQVTFSGGEIVLITEVPSQWLGTTQLIQFEFSSEGVATSRQISHTFEFDPGSLAFSGIEELQTADWGTPLPGLEKVAANLALIGLCNKFQEFDGVSPEIPCIEDGQPNSSGYLFQTTDQLLGQATYPQIFYEDELVILGRGWGARFFDSNWTEGDLSKLRSIGAFAFRSNQIPCDIDLGEGVEIGLCYGR